MAEKMTEEEYEEVEEEVEAGMSELRLKEALKAKKCFTIVEQNILERAIEFALENEEFVEALSDDMAITPEGARKIFDEATIQKISSMRCDRK
jgi:hypothetical protein